MTDRDLNSVVLQSLLDGVDLELASELLEKRGYGDDLRKLWKRSGE